LQGYDYAQAGAYFVTICTQARVCLFGEVTDGVICVNDVGGIVHEEWLRTASLRPRVTLDAFIVMPNHVHGIIVLGGRGTLQRAPTDQHAPTDGATVERFGRPTSNSLPTIVRLFKAATTKRINEWRGTPSAPVWQRSFYEHIIRNEAALNRIRQYILDNPARWMFDRENPLAVAAEPEDIWQV
jgi:REP element-mobilizing transposase RayT